VVKSPVFAFLRNWRCNPLLRSRLRCSADSREAFCRAAALCRFCGPTSEASGRLALAVTRPHQFPSCISTRRVSPLGG
jgi:hypothetical protein